MGDFQLLDAQIQMGRPLNGQMEKNSTETLHWELIWEIGQMILILVLTSKADSQRPAISGPDPANEKRHLWKSSVRGSSTCSNVLASSVIHCHVFVSSMPGKWPPNACKGHWFLLRMCKRCVRTLHLSDIQEQCPEQENRYQLPVFCCWTLWLNKLRASWSACRILFHFLWLCKYVCLGRPWLLPSLKPICILGIVCHSADLSNLKKLQISSWPHIRSYSRCAKCAQETWRQQNGELKSWNI